MKYFLFSDVHGEYTSLMHALHEAGFNVVDDSHILIGVGDYFDRGPENDRVYMFLKIMKELGRIKLIRGNHDEMLLDFLQATGSKAFVMNIIHNGLNKTIAQLSGQPDAAENLEVLVHGADAFRNDIKNKCPQILNLLNDMTDKIVIDNYVITHAGFTLKEDGMVVNNWAHTERMLEEHQSLLDPQLTYIFGHWHAQRLNQKFDLKTDNINKFVYKNFIGIDGRTNLTKEVPIHIIETSTNIF
jgi:serine/threonine protein phosphatase 1